MELVWSHDWRFLTPRFRILRDCLYILRERGNDKRDTLWFDVRLQNELVATLDQIRPAFKLNQLREALLLTAWMSSIKETQELWLQMAQRKRKESLQDIEAAINAGHFTPRFRVNLCCRKSTKLLDWYTGGRFLLGADGFTPEFTRDYEQMLSFYKSYGVDTSQTLSIPVYVRVGAEYMCKEPVAQVAHIKSVMDFIHNFKRHTAEIERLHPSRPRFHIDSIGLAINQFFVTSELVKTLQELMTMDIKIVSIDLPVMLPVKSRNRPDLWRGAWASLVLSACGHPNATIRPRYPIDQLTITFTYMSDDMYIAFCSAMAYARDTKSFMAEDESGRDYHSIRRSRPRIHRGDLTWRWIVYTLCSPYSSVQTINRRYPHLRIYCYRNNVGSVLDAKYPHTQLLEDSEDVDHGSVHLGRGTRIQFGEDADDAYSVQSPEGESFLVLRRDRTSTLVDVLVPGYGHGRVDCSDCPNKRQKTGKSSTSDETRRSRRTNLKRLAVEYTMYEYYLPYVGEGLDYLDLFGYMAKYDFATLDEILVYCPNLRQLSIDGFLATSVQPLIDAYANGRGPQSLKLRGPKIADEGSVLQFLELLATPTSMLARRLQELIVDRSLSASKAIHLSPRVVEALAKVVMTNTKLQHLNIDLTNLEQEMYKRSLDQLVRKSNKPFRENRVVSKPLAPRAIGAFLSVFEQRGHRLATRPKLDSCAVCLILSFAGTAVPRQITISTYTPSTY